jgi:putative ABC transport system permease protein
VNAFTITKLAFTRLLATKARSFLTMLGVVIGVASLVALTSIANGATSGINASLASLGAKQVTVSSGSETGLTEADAAALAEIADVDQASWQVSGQGTAVNGANSSQVSLTGVSASYAKIASPKIAIGSFLPSFAGDSVTRSVVLSATAASDLKVVAADIGKEILLDGRPFALAGVLDDASGFGRGGTAYISIDSARIMFAQAPYVSTITLVAATEDKVDAVQSAADTLLRARYGLSATDTAQFATSNQKSLLESFSSIQSTLTLLLVGISSISLVVGGIGIMNIMLVSVRERTREIGVRRAIGARQGHILAQFLIEAIVLSVVGGFLGLVVGLAVSAIIASVAGWAFTISGSTVALALGFSAAVGVVFGVWPARTASRLQPVDALRYE